MKHISREIPQKQSFACYAELTFSTSHASYFAISRYTSIAETEEGKMNDDNDDEDGQSVRVDFWKAYWYENNNGVSCSNGLAVEIKVRYFTKDAKVRIGNLEAFSADKKSGKKIVAKFCMDDLLKVKTDPKRTISITNPDTEKKKADKKINLDNIDMEIFQQMILLQIQPKESKISKKPLFCSIFWTGNISPVFTGR